MTPIRTQLIPDAPKARRKGTTKALVPIPADTCPACAEPTETEGVGQLPLLRHGGYGEVRFHFRRYCRCGWFLEGQVDSLNPRTA